MVDVTPEGVKEALIEAGLEIYGVSRDEIRIAERVRVHLMDSGVRVRVRSELRVLVTVRSQRSDFPNSSSEELFTKVRNAMAGLAQERGFVETQAEERQLTDPVDASNVLDVWHELTYAKDLPDFGAMLDDVRWAMELAKCVSH